ncbi:hypothetical protein GLYMA_16G158501v4 [Glycine max]|nr:hypothetical protein GLYMA_16G158501v4 [Glycine max]KAH1151630.1 hypothetical protein GYH30_045233 [Glycine max]
MENLILFYLHLQILFLHPCHQYFVPTTRSACILANLNRRDSNTG